MAVQHTIDGPDSSILAASFDLTMDDPAIYRIRVRGKLNDSWSEKLGGLRVETSNETAMTVLTGPLPDQAALSGILNTLYNLQFPVISVEYLPDSS